MAVWGGFANCWEKKKKKKLEAKEKRKDIAIWMQSSKEQQGDKKAFLSDQCKEIEESSSMGKTRERLQEN